MKPFLQFLAEKKIYETHYSPEQIKSLKDKHSDDKELMALIADYESKDNDETYQKIKSYMSSKD